MSKIQEFISTSLVQNLGTELLNAVQSEIDASETALYERKTLQFRDIVDSTFPTMLVVDYANIKKELQMYQDVELSLKTYISETYKPTQKDYDVNKLSNEEVNLLLRAIRLGVKRLTAKPISYKDLQRRLEIILQTAQSTSTTITEVKRLFNTPYKLTDTTFGDTDIYIFPNFARIGDLLRKPLDIGLTIAQEEAGREIDIKSIGSILNYGHTAAGYQDEDGNVVLNFNSPKLLAIMFEVIESTSQKANSNPSVEAIKAATFFVNDTKQTEAFVSIDKDFSNGFVKLFISIGGNVVRFENSLINSRRGSILEKTSKIGINRATLDRLATAFRKTQTTLGSRLARYITNKKSSPNILEYIKHSITQSIKGEPIGKHKSSTKDSAKSSKTSIQKQVVAGIAKQKAKIPKLSKPPTNIPARARRGASLVKLQSILDALLVTQVKQNMGDGSRRDILNLRTGRFAESVRVEKLSESRQGMITAFYTYMKNPYATFSTGGRQQSPRSRDPKLLISKSVRDIMQQQAITRLRAVSL